MSPTSPAFVTAAPNVTEASWNAAAFVPVIDANCVPLRVIPCVAVIPFAATFAA